MQLEIKNISKNYKEKNSIIRSQPDIYQGRVWTSWTERGRKNDTA